LEAFKSKFDMKAKPPYETDFLQPKYDERKANTGDVFTSDNLVFEMPPTEGCARRMTGRVRVGFRIKQPGGVNSAPYPDALNDMHTNNAVYVRANVGPNLVQSVEVTVNNTSVGRQEYHPLLAYVFGGLTRKREDADHDWEEYGGGIYHRGTIKADPARGQANGVAYTGPTMLTPATMPSSLQAAGDATTPSISETAEYAEKYTKRYLCGSKVHYVEFNLLHPMFQDSKMYPPRFACNISIQLADKRTLFQCTAGRMPTLELVSFVVIDEQFRLTPEASIQWNKQIMSNEKSEIILPSTRYVVSEVPLSLGRTQFVTLLTNRIPNRMVVLFQNNQDWKSASTLRNPFNFPYLMQKKVLIKYGDRAWPFREWELQGVPDLEPGTALNKEQVADLVRLNRARVKEMMSVFCPSKEVHKLDWKAEDWFEDFNAYCFDFTPTGKDVELGHVTYPLLVGYLNLDVEFARSFPAGSAYHAIAISYYTQEVVMDPPLFTVSVDSY
jgi:hypothetical protein